MCHSPTGMCRSPTGMCRSPTGMSLTHWYVSLTHWYVSLTHWYVSLTHWYVSLTHWYVSLTHWYVSLTHWYVSLTHWYVSLTHWYVVCVTHPLVLLSHRPVSASLVCWLSCLRPPVTWTHQSHCPSEMLPATATVATHPTIQVSLCHAIQNIIIYFFGIYLLIYFCSSNIANLTGLCKIPYILLCNVSLFHNLGYLSVSHWPKKYIGSKQIQYILLLSIPFLTTSKGILVCCLEYTICKILYHAHIRHTHTTTTHEK